MSTNPSHILIARSSRSSQPHATLSSPTETHAAASGIFPRTSSSPPWLIEDFGQELTIDELELDDDPATGAIEVDPTFRKEASWPGTIKILVEATTFWTHKDILVFSSPFFEAALSGSWSETGRPSSVSSVITISQPPPVPGSNFDSLSGSTAYSETVPNSSDDSERSDIEPFPMSESESDAETKETARRTSLEKLQGRRTSPSVGSSSAKHLSPGPLPKRSRKRRSKNIEGFIQLKEEKASTFHDFLKFVYPHLECTITWNNVEGLMNISHKLVVPSLQSACLNFLLTHAAGKPIKAMRIAELFEEEELYRESSRFVLDNPGGWSDAEIQTLSKETLLKLEKRRTWFLERVLKLGLVNIAKEYQCSPSCSEPASCARLVEEKWRQGYHALFRFGPAQPSMVYRYLRSLEGVSPPLSLTHLSCQTSAKTWVATLFDRMFSLKMDTTPLGAATGPRRHFLYCTLRSEPEKKGTRTRQ